MTRQVTEQDFRMPQYRGAEVNDYEFRSTFLSAPDIAQLTGRKFKSHQIDALRKMGIPFFVNAAGHAVVARSAIDSRSSIATAPIKAPWVPQVLRAG